MLFSVAVHILRCGRSSPPGEMKPAWPNRATWPWSDGCGETQLQPVPEVTRRGPSVCSGIPGRAIPTVPLPYAGSRATLVTFGALDPRNRPGRCAEELLTLAAFRMRFSEQQVPAMHGAKDRHAADIIRRSQDLQAGGRGPCFMSDRYSQVRHAVAGRGPARLPG